MAPDFRAKPPTRRRPPPTTALCVWHIATLAHCHIGTLPQGPFVFQEIGPWGIFKLYIVCEPHTLCESHTQRGGRRRVRAKVWSHWILLPHIHKIAIPRCGGQA